jgi:hypothetical protein
VAYIRLASANLYSFSIINKVNNVSGQRSAPLGQDASSGKHSKYRHSMSYANKHKLLLSSSCEHLFFQRKPTCIDIYKANTKYLPFICTAIIFLLSSKQHQRIMLSERAKQYKVRKNTCHLQLATGRNCWIVLVSVWRGGEARSPGQIIAK